MIRYDHRDTGRSVTYDLGNPQYTGAELVSDAAGVLDAFGILSAHIVGVSAAGHSPSCSRWITPTASSRQS